MLVLTISENFDKLLEDRRLTSIASLRKLGGIVVMAIDFAFVLIVAVRCSEDGWADRASEMFDVVFAIKSSDIGTSESAATLETEKIESTKIICLAQGILARTIFSINWKEFGSDNLTTVGTFETVQMVGSSKGANELAG